jgi:alkylation response protein AidB-like acyl-CoA dehydrogenase
VGLGNEEQRQRILSDVASNGATVATVGSEVRAREANSIHDKDGKLTFAAELVPAEGGFLASGVKGFSSMAADSKYICFWALAPGTETPTEGVTVSIMPRDDPGITFLPGWEEAIGIRGSLSGGAKFDNVFVPWANVLGEPGDHTQKHPYTFELTYTVELLGITQGVLDFVLQTLAERPFLREDNQTMYVVGEMISAVNSTRTAWWYAQATWDAHDNDRAAQLSLMALHQAKDTAMMVCTKAFEIVGVRGIFRWNPLDRAWRDVRVATLHTRETQLMRLVAEAEITGDYFAKAKYGFRLPEDQRVTWESLGLKPPANANGSTL